MKANEIYYVKLEVSGKKHTWKEGNQDDTIKQAFKGAGCLTNSIRWLESITRR